MGPAEALGGLIQDHRQHAVEILKNLPIPKTQHGPARIFKKHRPLRIISQRGLMLRAVKLQCQFRGPTRHVQNIGTNNQLPGKPRSIPR